MLISDNHLKESEILNKYYSEFRNNDRKNFHPRNNYITSDRSQNENQSKQNHNNFLNQNTNDPLNNQLQNHNTTNEISNQRRVCFSNHTSTEEQH